MAFLKTLWDFWIEDLRALMVELKQDETVSKFANANLNYFHNVFCQCKLCFFLESCRWSFRHVAGDASKSIWFPLDGCRFGALRCHQACAETIKQKQTCRRAATKYEKLEKILLSSGLVHVGLSILGALLEARQKWRDLTLSLETLQRLDLRINHLRWFQMKYHWNTSLGRWLWLLHFGWSPWKVELLRLFHVSALLCNVTSKNACGHRRISWESRRMKLCRKSKSWLNYHLAFSWIVCVQI